MALFTPLYTREEAICKKEKKRLTVVVANLADGITFLDSQHSQGGRLYSKCYSKFQRDMENMREVSLKHPATMCLNPTGFDGFIHQIHP